MVVRLVGVARFMRVEQVEAGADQGGRVRPGEAKGERVQEGP